MTKLIVRLILSTMLLPLAVVLFIGMMLVASLMTRSPGVGLIIFIFAVEFFFISIYWYLLWRPVVHWTPRRKSGTVLTAGLSIFAGLLFTGVIWVVVGDLEVAIGFGGIAPPLTFLLGTLAVWKETDEERSGRLQLQEGRPIECPGCGHDMRGLNSTTCPECGLTMNLQELLYSQTGFDSHSIEPHEPEDGT